jgi:hypothetical protein
MVYISRLACKQIEYLIANNPKSDFEKKILKEVLIKHFQNRGQFILCSLTNLNFLLQKINEYQLFVIGITTDIDEDIPLYTFNVEDYCTDFTTESTNWIKHAITQLLIEKKLVWLRFYVEIPNEQVEILILRTGIQLV